jgi:methionyl-tRNA formyltransferase
MTPLRVLFAGTPEVALPALDLLHADERFDVVAVLTNPDRPRGRSARPEGSAVALRARELGLPVLQPERPADELDRIVATGAEVGAVVAYGALLPVRVLEALPLGFVNLHLSVLPRWRGAAPVQHAIRSGDATTGATVFRLDEGMDTGPVLRQYERPIPADVDAGDLLELLAVEGAPLLAEGLLALASGEEAQAQSVEGVTLAPKLRPVDAAIDWTDDAAQVARAIRSVTPRPGAHTSLASERLKLAGVTVAADAGEQSPTTGPGTIHADEQGITVTCGSGSVRILRVQFPGRPWTSTADQVRGRRLSTGMVLGPHAEPT